MYKGEVRQIIEPSAVLRPCMAVADHDRRWDGHSTSKRYLSKLRYWGIRYSTTDRGYGYGNAENMLPPQAPTILSTDQLEEIYADIRRNNVGEFESDSSSSDDEYEDDGESL